jgi:hypothetical protein
LRDKGKVDRWAKEQFSDIMNNAMLSGENGIRMYEDPDEVALRQKLRGYDLRSVDLCYEEAKSTLHLQVRNIESLNGRMISVLQFDGVLLGVLVAIWSAILYTGFVPLLASAFILSAGFLIVVSAFCCFRGQRVRALKGAPQPKRLVEKYITWSTTLVKYQHVYTILKAIRLNEKVLDGMSWWLKTGMAFLAVALLLVFIAFMTRIAS